MNRHEAITSAISALTASGRFDVVWLDENLNVIDAIGQATNTVRVGEHLTDSIIAAIGLEDDIKALSLNPGEMLELPSVANAMSPDDNRRSSYTFFWDSSIGAYTMLIHRTKAASELEVELSRQNRARLMAEARTAAASRELARANADLESFAAIVSHDLKSPLRHIRTLADKILADPSVPKTPAIAEHVQGIEERAKRMSAMLSELFDYSSLGRKYEAASDVHTLETFATVISPWRDQGHVFAFRGSWPVLTTVRAPFELVVRNLVSNSIQHHDQPTATIALEAAQDEKNAIFLISDDGPGIPLDSQDVIFLPFRSLAPSANPQSTGMGLAMVKRALDSVGGSITVQSDPGQSRGTAFKIVWPRTLPSA